MTTDKRVDIRKHFVANFCDGDETEKAFTFTFVGTLDVAEYFYKLGTEDMISDVMERLDRMKTDERKVATFGDWQAETYEDKMLVNAVLTEAQNIIKEKLNN